MAPRPYWSGQIQISLVSFGVKLFTATESKSEIRFNQLSRKTGERIKYQKTTSAEEGSTVDNSDIVKGYEYSKGEYVIIEPEEIENLRVPSRYVLEVKQFVDAEEIGAEYFEKPYFVAPESDAQAEAFAVVRKALQDTKKIAIGKIAFSGREHLVAIAPYADDKLPGMMAFVMRYSEELRKPGEFFGDIKTPEVEEEQLSLAMELIKRKVAKFEPQKYKDEYEVALRALIDAKIQHLPVPQEEVSHQAPKVVSLMDALRKSVQPEKDPTPKKTRGQGAAAKASGGAAKKGITLVKEKARKSA
jgi:DNA end-binding protein Ku